MRLAKQEMAHRGMGIVAEYLIDGIRLCLVEHDAPILIEVVLQEKSAT